MVASRFLVPGLFSFLLLLSVAGMSGPDATAQRLTWMQPENPLKGLFWSTLTVDSDFVYVNTYSNASRDYIAGFQRSHINGGGWKMLRQNTMSYPSLRAAVRGNLCLLGVQEGGLLRSTDGGNSFTFEWPFESMDSTIDVVHLACAQRFNIITQTNNTIAVQEVGSNRWRLFTTVIEDPIVDMRVVDDSIFTVTKKRLWKAHYRDTVLTPCLELRDSVEEITSLAALPGVLLFGTSEGGYRSVDGGKTWKLLMVNDERKPLRVTSLTSFCAIAMNSSFDAVGIVYRSDDLGITWKLVPQFPALVADAVAYKNDVIAMDIRGRVICAKPVINDHLDLCSYPVDCALPVMAPHAVTGFVVCDKEPMKRLRNWDQWLPSTLPRMTVTDVAYVGDRLLAVGEGEDMAVSDDGGLSWFPLTATGLPANVRWKRLIVHNGMLVLHGADSSVYMSTGPDAKWTSVFTKVPDHVACYDSSVCVVSANRFCRLMTNARGWWIRQDTVTMIDGTASFRDGVRSLVARDTDRVYVLTHDGRFFVNRSGGANGSRWDERSVPFTDSIAFLRCTRNAVFAVLRPMGLMRSTDDGDSWQREETGLTDAVVDIKSAGPTLWASTEYKGLFVAFDDALVSVKSPSDPEQETSTLLHPQPASDLVRSPLFASCTAVSVSSSIGTSVGILPVMAGGHVDVSGLAPGMYLFSTVDANGALPRIAVRCMVWR